MIPGVTKRPRDCGPAADRPGPAGGRNRFACAAGRCSLLLSVVLILCLPSPLLAQSCALCKTALAGQASQTIRSLNLGILILLFPPLTVMSAILLVAIRRDR